MNPTLQAVPEQLKEFRMDISTNQGQQASSPGKLAAYQELKKDVSAGQEELKKDRCDIKATQSKLEEMATDTLDRQFMDIMVVVRHQSWSLCKVSSEPRVTGLDVEATQHRGNVMGCRGQCYLGASCQEFEMHLAAVEVGSGRNIQTSTVMVKQLKFDRSMS
jgi:hypothetical protein